MKEGLILFFKGLWFYIRGVLNIGSQLLLFALTGWSSGNESLSGACARLESKGRRWAIGRRFFDTLFLFEKNHCANSAWNDRDWAEAYVKDPYFETERPD